MCYLINNKIPIEESKEIVNKAIARMCRKSPPPDIIYFIENHEFKEIFIKGGVERTLSVFIFYVILKFYFIFHAYFVTKDFTSETSVFFMNEIKLKFLCVSL